MRAPGMGGGAILVAWRANVALVVVNLSYFAGLCGFEVGTSWEVYFLQQKTRVI